MPWVSRAPSKYLPGFDGYSLSISFTSVPDTRRVRQNRARLTTRAAESKRHTHRTLRWHGYTESRSTASYATQVLALAQT